MSRPRIPLSYRLIDRLRRIDSSTWYECVRSMENSSYDELGAYQITELTKLIKYVSTQVPYYMDFFRKNHMSCSDIKSIEDLRFLPIVTKKDIRSNVDGFVSMEFNKNRVFKKSTSGATGEPFTYFLDSDSMAFIRACRLKFWKWFGYELGDKYCTISGSSLIPSNHGSVKLKVYDFLDKRVSLPVGRLDEETIGEILGCVLGKRPRYIFGYPSVLYTICKYIEKTGLELKFVDKIITTSECLREEERKYIEQVLKSEVYDFYGCGDGTVVAAECEMHQGLHYAMEGTILECIAEDNGTGDRTEGKLLATSLTNYSMPFIRYDTSDLGYLEAGKCACGRGSVRIKKIIGRDRDQIVCGDGSLVHGVNINKIATESEWIERIQVIQKKSGNISVLIQPKYDPKGEEKEQFVKQMRQVIGDLPISLIFTNEFVLTGSNKFRSVISEAIDKGN